MPSIPVYELIDEAQRRPSPLAGERKLPILVFTGDALPTGTAVETAECFKLRAPYAEVNADETDVATIVDRLAGEKGSLTPWVKGTLLPPPRFPLTRFVLWAWSERETAAGEPKDPVGVRGTLRRSLSQRRKKDAFTGSALRVMFDYVGRTMTTWLPATGLATFGLQKLVDGVSLALWLASPIVAVIGALLHAALLIRGWLFYRWFRKAPYVRRRKGEDIIAYAISVGRADQDAVERLMVTALLEDLRQAYQRRVLPWPGWGRNTYPVVALRNADPGTMGRRFMELLDEVRVRGQRGPLLLVASTSEPPAGHRFDPPATGELEPVRQYRAWRAAIHRAEPSPYLVIRLTEAGASRSDDPARLLLARPLAFWAVVLALLVVPVMATVTATAGCGAELREVDGQCVGLGALGKMAPHPLVAPVARRIEEQNAAIPLGHKVFTVAYLGPLTTQPGAQFKDGQMTAVAGELAGIGAYQKSYNTSRSDWKMKIVFANTGQDFISAELAATGIAERAREDSSLAAAVGFAWSREEVKRAVGVLTRANVPMVSTVTTVGDIAEVGDRRSAFLFRLAVVNSLQMKATVHWLETLGLAEGVRKKPKVAVVWQRQDGELYSQDLKDLFLAEYPGESADFSFGDDASLGVAMREACGSGAEVVYYTGRADFLSSLRRDWGASCEQREIRLLASDDVTGSVAKDVRSNPAAHDVSMSFVSLTDVRDTSLTNQSQQTLRRWIAESGVGVSFAHAAFGFDAAQAVAIAFSAYRTQSEADDILSGVHYNLRGQAFDGATGKVSFSEHATDHDAQGREVWLMTVESGRPIQATWVCRPTATAAECASPSE
ncbi:ABC transporter substrate-binding protein [Nonomuraea sp. NPDC050478]|uniref:ABC transporter substrate-binding protein n=1 Tax=Nonomuraea sp. NPDC050478 TaxID=3364365 RepID=UPI0037AE86C4